MPAPRGAAPVRCMRIQLFCGCMLALGRCAPVNFCMRSVLLNTDTLPGHRAPLVSGQVALLMYNSDTGTLHGVWSAQRKARRPATLLPAACAAPHVLHASLCVCQEACAGLTFTVSLSSRVSNDQGGSRPFVCPLHSCRTRPILPNGGPRRRLPSAASACCRRCLWPMCKATCSGRLMRRGCPKRLLLPT